jgi:putative transposase
MKTAGQNPSAGITGTAQRTVPKGGYVGVLASKFYAGYNRRGEQVTITWDATTVTITDTSGTAIATYAKPSQRRGWHGPAHTKPSTKT